MPTGCSFLCAFLDAHKRRYMLTQPIILFFPMRLLHREQKVYKKSIKVSFIYTKEDKKTLKIFKKYILVFSKPALIGLAGLEPAIATLWAPCSNQLNYKPSCSKKKERRFSYAPEKGAICSLLLIRWAYRDNKRRQLLFSMRRRLAALFLLEFCILCAEGIQAC